MTLRGSVKSSITSFKLGIITLCTEGAQKNHQDDTVTLSSCTTK